MFGVLTLGSPRWLMAWARCASPNTQMTFIRLRGRSSKWRSIRRLSGAAGRPAILCYPDAMSRSRANVIWIYGDLHRGQAQGHMGDPNAVTPNLDRLAADGVTFTRAVSNCPWCTPACST